MLYATEVMRLMADHPGREFRMLEIRTYVEATLRVDKTDRQRREAIRQGVVRVLESLVETGAVYTSRPESKRSIMYVWRVVT